MRHFLGLSSRNRNIDKQTPYRQITYKQVSLNYAAVIALLITLPSMSSVAGATVAHSDYPHYSVDSLSTVRHLDTENVSATSVIQNVSKHSITYNRDRVREADPKSKYSSPLITASSALVYPDNDDLEQDSAVDDIDAIADIDEIQSIDDDIDSYIDNDAYDDGNYNNPNYNNSDLYDDNLHNNVTGNSDTDDNSADQDYASTSGSEYEHSHVVFEDKASLDLTSQHVPLNAISPNTIQTFVEVIDTVRRDYVKPVNDEALFQYAISGMLEKLDSHAEYLTPEKYDNLRGFTDGEIGKVGLSADFDTLKREWVIDSVVVDSSANQSGVKVGDKLIRIKKAELTSDMTRQDVEQLLSGIAGSQVQVQIETPLGEKRRVVLQRNLSTNTKLEVIMHEGIAVVRLPIFQNSTKNQLIEAIRRTGEPVSGVILDVRNNPGGVLSAAIDVASLFIADKGLILVKNRTNSSQIIKPNGIPYLSGIPVVVLLNRYSASASEVLASSLKNNANAIIMGEKSFGKGTVQEVIPLKVGGAIKLTVAEYRSVKGEKIDGVGIEPDIALTHDDGDWQHQAIIMLLSQDRHKGVMLNDSQAGLLPIDDY